VRNPAVRYEVVLVGSGEVIARRSLYSEAAHQAEAQNRSVDDPAFKATVRDTWTPRVAAT
jgi:hypothetical protein